MKKLLATIGLWLGLTSPAWALFCPSNVLTLSPQACFPMQETSGTVITDTIAGNNGTISGSYVLNQNGGIDCQGSSGNGCNIVTTNQYASPQPASFYFAFAGTSGGIFQLGNASSTTGFPYYLGYLDNHGKLTIGVNNNGIQVVVQSPQSYADGNKHLALVTVGPVYGTSLYVDGQKVASSGNTFANYATGYLFMGGVNPTGWQLSPSNSYFNGTFYTFAYWNARELTPAQAISATGGLPASITNNYCTFTNQIASLDPSIGQAYANKKLTFKLNPSFQIPGLGSSLPIGPSTIVCTTDNSGNISAGCQIPQGAHVDLNIGNAQPIPLVIPASTSCDLTAIIASQTDPPEVVSSVAVAGPLYQGTTVTNPPPGQIGTATLTSPITATYTCAPGGSVTIDRNLGAQAMVSMTGSGSTCTINFSHILDGAPPYLVDFVEDSTGGTTPTFVAPTGFTISWPGPTAVQPGQLTSASLHTVYQFMVEGTVMQGSIANWTVSGGSGFPLTGTANFNYYSGANVNTFDLVQVTPVISNVTATCTSACATTYDYEIACNGDNGTKGPSAIVTAVNNSALSSTNYNTVNWTTATLCRGGYTVYGRAHGGPYGSLATCTGTSGNCTATSYKDDGSATPNLGFPPPNQNTTGVVRTNGSTLTTFNNLSPLTTLGDVLYENATPENARLGGNVSQLSTPTFGNSNVTNVGTTGATTATYYTVCIDSNGGKTLPSAAGATTTGNATLNSTNYNAIALPYQLGCVSYDILKGDTAHSLALAQTGPTYNDQGGSTSAYTAPVANTTYKAGYLNSTPNTSNVAQAPSWTTVPATASSGIGNVTVTGNATANYVLQASSASAATWVNSGAIAPHGMQIFTSNGTFTVPSNTYAVLFEALGGGGGGGGYGTSGSPGVGGAGNNTTVVGAGTAGSTLTGGGGQGGAASVSVAAAGAPGGSGSNGTFNSPGGNGFPGNVNDQGSLSTGHGGYGGTTVLVAGTNGGGTPYGTGGAGGGDSNGSVTVGGGGGGGGGYAKNVVTTTPGSTFAVTIGTGGSAGTVGTGTRPQAGVAGQPGIVVATW